MPVLRWMVSLIGAVTACSAAAQSEAERQQDIVIEADRLPNGENIPMSDWRVAEGQHVVVYSKGSEARLVRIAHNLEKLHFLLSVLLNRVDENEPALKLRITLIGDVADFKQMDLRNLRWQEGPFPKTFPVSRYYDPRETGAVLANPDIDQAIILQPGRIGMNASDFATPTQLPPGLNQDVIGADSAMALDGRTVSESVVPMSSEGRLYAGYAQHYLLTYFPAAYPRWYLDGFGEIFSTMSTNEGLIEYGRAPAGFRQVMATFLRYPLTDILSGKYLQKDNDLPAWTPYHAWALAHLTFFSEEWRSPLRAYLAAVASGKPPEAAAAALGDVARLQKLLSAYHGSKVPFETMRYPADRIAPPFARRLRQTEAWLVQGRLELGARIALPPEPVAGAEPKAAERARQALHEAVGKRDSWLADLRARAARDRGATEVQLLLAEAECRTEKPAACLAAADVVLLSRPQDPEALSWKGHALAALAIAGPQDARSSSLRAARTLIARANRLDTEATLPLLAYYRSFVAAGEVPSSLAVDGLAKASESVPAAPVPRLMLGAELARRGDWAAARRILRPVAEGPYESPEKPAARNLLDKMPK